MFIEKKDSPKEAKSSKDLIAYMIYANEINLSVHLEFPDYDPVRSF